MESSKGIYDISDLHFKYPDMWHCESLFDEHNHLVVNLTIKQQGKTELKYQINFGKIIFYNMIEESWFDMADLTVGRWEDFNSNYLFFEIRDSELVKDLVYSRVYDTSLHHYFLTTTNWYLEIVTKEVAVCKLID